MLNLKARQASTSRRLIWSTLAVQLMLVSVSFPITQLITSAPLFYIDSPFHWYEIEAAKGFAAAWRILGYDPYFAAGYIGGVGFNVSAKLPAALCIILSPWLSTTVTYKLYVFGAAILGPACVPLAARSLGLSGRVSLAATIFAVFLWWLSALRWFHTAGLVSFVFGSYLALPYAVLILRFLCLPMAWPLLLVLGAIGAAGMFLHPLFPLLVAPLVLSLSLAHWRELDMARLISVCTVLPLLCLLPNLLWIVPMLKYPSFAAGVAQPYQQVVGFSLLWNEAIGRITLEARGSRVNTVIWFCILWMLGTQFEPRAKLIGVAFTIAGAGLLLFAAFGAALPFLATAQPNRFSSAAYLYLCIPAGLGTVAAVEKLNSQGWTRLIAMGSTALLAGAAVFFVRELAQELSYADTPHHGERPPEVRGVGPESTWIVEWLKNNTKTDARVLFETSKGRVHDEAHMLGYYARVSDREFIGGPYPYIFFAGFWDGYLFGRSIASFSASDFTDYLRLYNIGWIVVFSEASRKFLDRLPGISPGEKFGPIQTYTVAGPHSFFAEGSGVVSERSFNRIELSQLSGPSVIIKYHFTPGLVSVPPSDIKPVLMPGDLEPFIRITNPPPHLVLEQQ